MEKGVSIVVEGRMPSALGLSKAEVRAAAAYFAARSRARIGNPVWHKVVVHLVDDAASDAIHRAIMGIAGVTDVVTQAYDAIPPETPGLYGEIFVNTDQARRAAPKRRGWSVAKELLLYVAHGMDHLSGADDHAECDYRAMRRRELSWLKVEKWKSGKVEEWKSGKVEAWKGGRVEKWKGGKVERWKSGKVEEGEGAINVIL